MNQITFNLVVGVLLRAVVMMVAGWLVAQGALPEGTKEDWVAAASLMLVGLAWSLWQKYSSRVAFFTALESPPGTTEAQVKAKIASGKGAILVVPLLLASLMSQGCAAKQYPNLSPEAQKQYDATEVAKRVNRLMDTVITAEENGSISRNTARAIVSFCVEADKTLVQYPNGWGPTIATAWKVLKDDPTIKPLLLSNQYISTAATLLDLALLPWTPQKEPAWDFSLLPSPSS